jgi:hypothetical protein
VPLVCAGCWAARLQSRIKNLIGARRLKRVLRATPGGLHRAQKVPLGLTTCVQGRAAGTRWVGLGSGLWGVKDCWGQSSM